MWGQIWKCSMKIKNGNSFVRPCQLFQSHQCTTWLVWSSRKTYDTNCNLQSLSWFILICRWNFRHKTPSLNTSDKINSSRIFVCGKIFICVCEIFSILITRLGTGLAWRVQCWQPRCPERTVSLRPSHRRSPPGGGKALWILRKYSLQVFTFSQCIVTAGTPGGRRRGQFQTQIIVGSLLGDAGKLESDRKTRKQNKNAFRIIYKLTRLKGQGSVPRLFANSSNLIYYST